jgi:hypothetical protein
LAILESEVKDIGLIKYYYDELSKLILQQEKYLKRLLLIRPGVGVGKKITQSKLDDFIVSAEEDLLLIKTLKAT